MYVEVVFGEVEFYVCVVVDVVVIVLEDLVGIYVIGLD